MPLRKYFPKLNRGGRFFVLLIFCLRLTIWKVGWLQQEVKTQHKTAPLNHERVEQETKQPQQEEIIPQSGYKNATPENSSETKELVIYSEEGVDRTGAVLRDMLYCHAYSYRHNATYGGSCGIHNRTYIYMRFLKLLGLEKILPFDCPKNDGRQEKFVKRGEYVWGPLPTEWLQQVRKHVKYPPPLQNYSIVVHIRRGDVRPCGDTSDRYYPNSLYLELLSQYINLAKVGKNITEEEINVTVFSERESHEPFDEFAKRGYNLVLSEDPWQVWEAILVSDVTITSRSSFSTMPSLLGKGLIVYARTFEFPLPDRFVSADKQTIKRGHDELTRLQASCRPGEMRTHWW